jgi:glycine cleavage system H protein
MRTEWVEVAGSFATIGITKTAVQEIGEIVYVELPEVGSLVTQGDDVVVVESTKAAIDISSPVSGKVASVNTKLLCNAELINKDPEKEGWLFQVELPVHNLNLDLDHDLNLEKDHDQD